MTFRVAAFTTRRIEVGDDVEWLEGDLALRGEVRYVNDHHSLPSPVLLIELDCASAKLVYDNAIGSMNVSESEVHRRGP